MIVVITGGSKGIGKNIVKNLLKKKIKVINISRSKCSLDDVKNYKCDISDYEEVKNIFKKIKNFDVLINNSGISKFDNNNINTFNKIVDINLKGLFYCSIEAFKKLKKKNNASIINICSINAHQAFPNNPGYVASKGGVLSLTRSLALDFSKYKIRVNSVSPGYIKTNMTKKSFKSRKNFNERKNRTMLNRWGKSDDLFGIIEYLISKKSSYTTGQDFVIDGGWLSKGL
jgi:gluconate 5-dehydrogenase